MCLKLCVFDFQLENVLSLEHCVNVMLMQTEQFPLLQLHI